MTHPLAFIIGLIIVVSLVILLWNNNNKRDIVTVPERFSPVVSDGWVVEDYDDYGEDESTEVFSSVNSWPMGTAPLEKLNMTNDSNINDYNMNNMVCSKKCCGNQWAVPFDQLTAEEAAQVL
nr:hypothetical protein [Nitrosopumilus sp.]